MMERLLRLADEIEHGIPSRYHVELAKRLAIAWSEQKRNRFTGKRRPRAETIMSHRKNRARIQYLQVQDGNCHLFLAFVLAYSPRALVDFKAKEITEFREYGRDKIWVGANLETKKLINTMALREGFSQNLHYLAFMRKMFPEGSKELKPVVETMGSKSAKSAEDEVRMNTEQPEELAPGQMCRQIERMYSNGPISQVSLFGELLSNATQGSRQWKKERELGESTTNCWTTMIPKDPNQDISITMWLGRKEGYRVNEALMVEPTWSYVSLPKPA